MKRRLKKSVREAFVAETPEHREQIVAACERETQLPPRTPVPSSPQRGWMFRRLAAAVLCLVLFGAGILIGYLIPASTPAVTAETCVYLDVNPSLELTLDIDNRVISCTAVNADAAAVLHGLTLEGTELRTALSAIVGAMYVKGYLNTSENSMLISVDTNDKSNSSAFLSYITEQINAVFADSDMTCSIIAQSVTADDTLKSRAEENGVSVGKMHLVDKMVERMDFLTEENVSELSSMSIKDLNLMYSMNPKHEQEEAQEPEEVLSGDVGGYLTRVHALAAVLADLGVDTTQVEQYDVIAVPDHRADEMHMVYAVTVRLRDDGTVYRYTVDCKTGDVSQWRTGEGAGSGSPYPGDHEDPPNGSQKPSGETPGNPPAYPSDGSDTEPRKPDDYGNGQ